MRRCNDAQCQKKAASTSRRSELPAGYFRHGHKDNLGRRFIRSGGGSLTFRQVVLLNIAAWPAAGRFDPL
jgi:hypothetical protein